MKLEQKSLRDSFVPQVKTSESCNGQGGDMYRLTFFNQKWTKNDPKTKFQKSEMKSSKVNPDQTFNPH